MAGQKNWEVDYNTTFTFVVEYKDPDGDIIEIQNSSAKLQVRDSKGDKLAFTLTSPSGGIIIDGALGKLTVKMTPTQTSKLFYPKSTYDLMLTDSNLNKIKLIGGYITLNKTVTI
jgi:hypothetical protein